VSKKKRKKPIIAYVPDNLLEMKPVAAEDKVQFQCTRCGECCRHVKDGVMLDVLDAFRLTRYLRKTGDVNEIEDVLLKYAHAQYIAEGVKLPIFLLNTTGKDDRCVFLKDNRCTVQNEKPRACRLYPFGATPDDAGGYDFSIVSQKPHHFRGRTVRVGDWMEENLTAEDNAYMEMDIEALKQLAPALKVEDKSGEDFALSMTLFLRYFNYDLDKPFIEQFARNMASLHTALSKGCGVEHGV